MFNLSKYRHKLYTLENIERLILSNEDCESEQIDLWVRRFSDLCYCLQMDISEYKEKNKAEIQGNKLNFEQQEIFTRELLSELKAKISESCQSNSGKREFLLEIFNIDTNQCIESVKLVLVQFVTDKGQFFNTLLKDITVSLVDMIGPKIDSVGLISTNNIRIVEYMLDAGVKFTTTESDFLRVLITALRPESYNIRSCYSLMNFMLSNVKFHSFKEDTAMFAKLADCYKKDVDDTIDKCIKSAGCASFADKKEIVNELFKVRYEEETVTNFKLFREILLYILDCSEDQQSEKTTPEVLKAEPENVVMNIGETAACQGDVAKYDDLLPQNDVYENMAQALSEDEIAEYDDPLLQNDLYEDGAQGLLEGDITECDEPLPQNDVHEDGAQALLESNFATAAEAAAENNIEGCYNTDEDLGPNSCCGTVSDQLIESAIKNHANKACVQYVKASLDSYGIKCLPEVIMHIVYMLQTHNHIQEVIERTENTVLPSHRLDAVNPIQSAVSGLGI